MSWPEFPVSTQKNVNSDCTPDGLSGGALVGAAFHSKRSCCLRRVSIAGLLVGLRLASHVALQQELCYNEARTQNQPKGRRNQVCLSFRPPWAKHLPTHAASSESIWPLLIVYFTGKFVSFLWYILRLSGQIIPCIFNSISKTLLTDSKLHGLEVSSADLCSALLILPQADCVTCCEAFF